MSKALFLRIFSAVIALGLYFGLWWQFGEMGLAVLSAGVVIVGQWEFSQMAFRGMRDSLRFRLLFLVLCLGCFVCTALSVNEALMAFGLMASVFLGFLLWRSRHQNMPLDELFRYQSIGLLGLVYCGLFPGCATRLLFLEKGAEFFTGFLAIVFIGDTMAFFGGSYLNWGRGKLFADISPQKTKVGAICGFLGSVAVGLLILGPLVETPWWYLLIAAALTSFFAQTGDLFESLIKRVAQVKDSGQIMPGHGGFLDRVDGVYFSAPIFLFFAYFAESLF